MQDPRQTSGQPIGQPSPQPGLRPAAPQHHAPSIRPPGAPQTGPHPVAGSGQAPRPVVPSQRPLPANDEEPIALVDDDAVPVDQTTEFTKKIKALGDAGTHRKHHDWKRKVVNTGTGAIRVKSFHGKYSDQGLQYLDDAINEWLDANPDIEVKFVTPTVGVFEGKIREPALVLNIWY
ncbi:MAG: hypothetical protein NZ561_04945 [Phycisphaerae bacterium]|nr:hypothetical protein [Phycisphaerae bacterium]MDW8262834.1 hypothetical protein [Phycisphaerales bacterium]